MAIKIVIRETRKRCVLLHLKFINYELYILCFYYISTHKSLSQQQISRFLMSTPFTESWPPSWQPAPCFSQAWNPSAQSWIATMASVPPCSPRSCNRVFWSCQFLRCEGTVAHCIEQLAPSLNTEKVYISRNSLLHAEPHGGGAGPLHLGAVATAVGVARDVYTLVTLIALQTFSCAGKYSLQGMNSL